MCAWWRHSHNWLQVHGSCTKGLHWNPPSAQLPCKVNYLGPHFQKNPANRTQESCSIVSLLLMCIFWYRSFISKWCSPSVLRLQLEPQQGVCGHPGQPLLEHSPVVGEVPVLVYLLTSAWGKPTSTGEAPGSCLSSHYWYTTEHIGSCYFAGSGQSDPLRHLQGNWPHFTSRGTRGKRLRELKTKGFRFA